MVTLFCVKEIIFSSLFGFYNSNYEYINIQVKIVIDLELPFVKLFRLVVLKASILQGYILVLML